MIPAAVYRSAIRAYILSSLNLSTDDETVRAWARGQWPNVNIDDMRPELVVFWVISIAAVDGHE